MVIHFQDTDVALAAVMSSIRFVKKTLFAMSWSSLSLLFERDHLCLCIICQITFLFVSLTRSATHIVSLSNTTHSHKSELLFFFFSFTNRDAKLERDLAGAEDGPEIAGDREKVEKEEDGDVGGAPSDAVVGEDGDGDKVEEHKGRPANDPKDDRRRNPVHYRLALVLLDDSWLCRQSVSHLLHHSRLYVLCLGLHVHSL